MKKIAMFIAAAAIAVSASAQKTAVTASKALDNIYVGVAAGAETKASKQNLGAFAAFNPNLTIMVGKNFDPIFGVRFEGVTRFNVHKSATGGNCKWGADGKFVNAIDVNALGTFNLSNLFGGYKGEPRTLEFIALYGFGWTHSFNTKTAQSYHNNAINSKAGLEVALNLGSKKQWQIFVEPSITFLMQGYNGFAAVAPEFQYNLNRANLDLKAGIIYKLPTSNGTHNFAIEQLRDQAEIDALNAQINGLRGDLDAANNANAQKDAQIAQLKKALADCENKPVVEAKAANLQPSVIFRQGKSVIDKAQEANVEMIAKYMKNNKDAKVKISGYASPEGSAELNQKLSEDRAAAVKNMLVKKYKISADRLETEGLGATDKLFDEVEFNRVALFNDTTK